MTEIKLTKKEEKEMLLKALFGSPFFNIFASVLATFIVGTVFFRYGGGVPINVTSSTQEKVSAFEMSGEGKVTVIPDEARISLGVRKQGRSVAIIQEQVNSTMSKLATALKELGIDEKNIKTSSYSLNQDYRDQGGYVAYAQFQVKIGEIEKTSQVLDLVGQLGLEQVSGVSFGLSDKLEKESTKEARELAIEEAKDKAEELAKLAGMKLGKIVNVQENGRYPQPYLMRSEMAMLDSSTDQELAAPTLVEVGSSEVSVSVTLSYETL